MHQTRDGEVHPRRQVVRELVHENSQGEGHCWPARTDAGPVLASKEARVCPNLISLLLGKTRWAASSRHLSWLPALIRSRRKTLLRISRSSACFLPCLLAPSSLATRPTRLCLTHPLHLVTPTDRDRPPVLIRALPPPFSPSPPPSPRTSPFASPSPPSPGCSRWACCTPSLGRPSPCKTILLGRGRRRRASHVVPGLAAGNDLG